MYNQSLNVLVAVAEQGSFAKAAERLYVSAPSVMKQINSLERHLDLKLMERSNQGVTLTPAGEVVYSHAKKMIRHSRKALEEARRAAQSEAVTIRVGASLLYPSKPLVDVWYRANSAFPNYNLSIIPFDDQHANVLSEIAALGDKFDFIVGACDSAQWFDHCSFFPLGSYQLCCAVARSHRLAGKVELEVSDLFGEVLMMVQRGDVENLDRFRDELEADYPLITIEDTTQFYDAEVFNRCAETGKVLLTLDAWKDVHPALVTIPVRWNHVVPYGLMYAKEPRKEVAAVLQTLEKLNP